MEEDNKKKLITEKITGRRLTPRRIGKFAAAAAICGVTFGFGASAAFQMTNFLQQKHAEKESITETIAEESSAVESSMAETTTAAETESSKAQESQPETSISSEESTAAETEAETETEPEDETERIRKMLAVPVDATMLANNYLVTVSAISQTHTWFESDMENTESYSGLVISADKHEILILTTLTDTEGKELKVLFNNGNSSDAYVKQASLSDGLSVIAVSSTEGISEETVTMLQPVEYADTRELRNGSSIIAIGSPLGVAGSCSYGQVGYINPNEKAKDCSQQVIYSEISSNSERGTFIIDYSGSLVGIVSSDKAETDVADGLTRIISIASIRRLINTLSAGNKTALFGIKGTSVSFDMKYNDIPEGVYVSEVLSNSPAFNAGIMRGDIITSIDEKEVTDMDSFTRIVNNEKPGNTAPITIMRGPVNGEYNEITYEVVFGER